MESLGEFKSRQQSTSVVELQFPSKESAAVTSREKDGLKKISDKAASFFPPSPLCLDDPSPPPLASWSSSTFHPSIYPHIPSGTDTLARRRSHSSSPLLCASSACLSNVQKCQKLPDKARKKKCREGNGAIDPLAMIGSRAIHI